MAIQIARFRPFKLLESGMTAFVFFVRLEHVARCGNNMFLSDDESPSESSDAAETAARVEHGSIFRCLEAGSGAALDEACFR